MSGGSYNYAYRQIDELEACQEGRSETKGGT